jgi:hypothetical protein
MSIAKVISEKLKTNGIRVSKVYEKTRMTDPCVVINDRLHIQIHATNLFTIVRIDENGLWHRSDDIFFIPVLLRFIQENLKNN